MSNFELEESNVLRDALANGIIDPVLPVFDKIDKRVFQWAIDNFVPQPDWQKDPQFAPETQRYIESVMPVLEQVPTEYWLVELARIPVPRGSVGYLKNIEQFLQDDDASFYPTGSEYWGLPYQEDADLKACRWYLRLQEFDGTLPARFNKSVPGAINVESDLPGFPNWDLPEFQNIWYPPHCAQKFPSLLIPGGYMLRFFFYSPPTTTWTWQVLGRLRAVVQSALCKEATWNTRITSW